LIVNHPKDICQKLRLGQKAFINYNEAVLSIVGFETEESFIRGKNPYAQSPSQIR
jgi:hypothetical protein